MTRTPSIFTDDLSNCGGEIPVRIWYNVSTTSIFSSSADKRGLDLHVMERTRRNWVWMCGPIRLVVPGKRSRSTALSMAGSINSSSFSGLCLKLSTIRETQRQPCSTTLGSLLERTFRRVGITSRTTGNESVGRFRQQFAAVVTAVRCVLVGKKSRYVRHAVKPPSRTIEAGKSTEILDKV